MSDARRTIEQVYAAFNDRDVDRVFTCMSDSVDWPKASEGGRVVGKDAVRAYWTRQWQEFDPHVEPAGIVEEADGRVSVRVHQLVKDRSGNVLSDSEVVHLYTFAGGLIERMDLDTGAGSLPSAAFARS